jgi:hypothetical protein
VTIDGRGYSYAYHLTREYPYTLGCFAGRLLEGTLEDARDGLEPSRGRRPRPRGRGRDDAGTGGASPTGGS